jgi:peroxiredoxin
MTRPKRQHVLGGLIALLLAGFLFVIEPSFRDLAGPAVAVGDAAPAFRLTAETGQPVDLNDFRGRFLVLNFWATWCPPCVEEMPSLNQFHKQFAGRGVIVLGVSVDRDREAYQRFLERAGVEFLTVRDPERKVSRLYGTFKYPETYFIDPQGKVVQKIIGKADWTDPRMFDYMNQLLKS